MKKLIAVLAALVLMLSGCSTQVMDYPRASPSSPHAISPLTLDITIPAESNEAVETAVVTLAAKLIELSGGNLRLEVYRAGDIADAMSRGGAGLYLLPSHQVAEADARLEFIEMPFLFGSAEELLTMLNSSDGEVRTSPVTKERLGGEVIGVYYGGTTWFLGKGQLYDEVGFFSSMGVLAGYGGNECFSVLGAENITMGSHEELFTAFAEEKMKFCEWRPNEMPPAEVLDKVKTLELTNHRFDSRWLVLKDPESILEPAACSMIREAFAYTILQQDTLQRDLDMAAMAKLEGQLNLNLDEQVRYAHMRQLAVKYYRENWQDLGIPQKIWDEITVLAAK